MKKYIKYIKQINIYIIKYIYIIFNKDIIKNIEKEHSRQLYKKLFGDFNKYDPDFSKLSTEERRDMEAFCFKMANDKWFSRIMNNLKQESFCSFYVPTEDQIKGDYLTKTSEIQKLRDVRHFCAGILRFEDFIKINRNRHQDRLNRQ